MKSAAGAETLTAVDWNAWEPVDRATLLFLFDTDRVLLIRKKRGLGAGKINGPGGRLDPGESWHDAAVREAEEEVGIRARSVAEHGELRFQFVDGYSIHVRVFRADAYTGAVRETDEAIPMWVPLDAIPYEEMWEDDAIWLPMLLNRQRFSGRFIFDGDRMLDHEIIELARDRPSEETPWTG